MGTVTERLEVLLREAGAEFRVLEHAPVFTSEEAARVRGTTPEAGAKTLVVRAEGRYAHLVLPGNRRVDNARLRAVLGTRKLRFATAEELEMLTGCAPGAVPPFGNLFGFPVYVDAALTACEWIVFNAGSHTVSFTMRCEDFVSLAGATVCRLSED